MANDTNTQARALTFSAIGRDFQLITLTSVIANLVTLYIVSIGTEAKLATSVVIISILIFALLSGINTVLVNGVIVVENGLHNGNRPGRVLRGPGYDL